MKPEKLLHTHNSIPSYTADLDDGCIWCIRNQAIMDMEAYYEPIVKELQERIDTLNIAYKGAEAIQEKANEVIKEQGEIIANLQSQLKQLKEGLLTKDEIKEMVEKYACYADGCIEKIATAIHNRIQGIGVI